MKKKYILSALCILPILVVGFYVQKYIPFKSEKSEIPIPKNHSAQYNSDSTITLIAVGDIMMGTNYPSSKYLPPYDLFLMDSVKEFLSNADLTFGNMEGAVLDNGGIPKKCSDPSVCYAFRQPTYFLSQLKNIGFDVFSVANNHMGDFGDVGRTKTCENLDNHQFHYAGLISCPWDTFSVQGVKVGFTAFAPNTGCLELNDEELLKTTVNQLQKISDIVIVSFHGGGEGSSRSHIVKGHEIFLGEDRGDVQRFARIAIDAGADVILGHGPHVTRAIDYYKGRFITYSMGNFCTYGRFNLSGINGIAPIYKLTIKKDGTFVKGHITSIQQTGEGGPKLDPQKRAMEEIRKLTASDSKGVTLRLQTDGYFTFE